MTVQATQTFAAVRKAERLGYRYIVLEGSTRSGKTYAVCQYMASSCVERPGLEVDVIRKTFPALRRDAMSTFEEVLDNMGLYSKATHNKTHHRYGIGTSRVEFGSADQEHKLRGPERDLLYCSEANNLTRDDWRQLTRRTRGTIILDYNPSHGANHWIDREVISDPQSVVIRSTYEQNPFLTPAQIADIERDIPVYEESDGTLVHDRDLTYDGDGVLVKGNPEDWAVYGLGLRAKSPALVYQHWQKLPWTREVKTVAYGLDFGNAVPSALIEVGMEEMPSTHDDRLFWRELVYSAGLTTPQLIARMDAEGVDKNTPIYADHESDRIKQIADAGYLIGPANKSVESGFDTVKQHALCITPGSVNVIDEIQQYRRPTVEGQILKDQVIKENDHAMDAGRYGTHSHFHGVTPGNRRKAFGGILGTT
jgi:phage terminase large subunit